MRSLGLSILAKLSDRASLSVEGAYGYLVAGRLHSHATEYTWLPVLGAHWEMEYFLLVFGVKDVRKLGASIAPNE